MDTLQRSTFTVRTYGRTELAQLYNPHIDPKNAFRKLRAWIAYNPALTQQLAELTTASCHSLGARTRFPSVSLMQVGFSIWKSLKTTKQGHT